MFIVYTKIYSGIGIAILDYGNCYTMSDSEVRVYVDGEEIDVAYGNTASKQVEFTFKQGSKLELVEGEPNGYIRFNSITISECGLPFWKLEFVKWHHRGYKMRLPIFD